jgi:hypothetical protein
MLGRVTPSGHHAGTPTGCHAAFGPGHPRERPPPPAALDDPRDRPGPTPYMPHDHVRALLALL